MKIIERQEAIKLRNKGFTFNEIRETLGISKGSLSLWLKNIPYTLPERNNIKRKLASIRNGQVLHKRKIKRISKIVRRSKKEIENVNHYQLKLLGTMAYWTEGSKTQDSLVKFTNSNPEFIKFAVKWLREVCLVPEEKLHLHLRIHNDLNKKEIEKYWSKQTNIPLERFYKTTFKESESNGKGYNKLKYGIASVIVCDTDLFYKISGWIEGIKEKFIFN